MLHARPFASQWQGKLTPAVRLCMDPVVSDFNGILSFERGESSGKGKEKTQVQYNDDPFQNPLNSGCNGFFPKNGWCG
ncbi:hypothetical protein SUGI_0807180 [Cryptomeria japonica]|nr:hypothetical protein SUGI_0807180 [Cryptomeria japonica]